MNKGMIRAISATGVFLLVLSASLAAEIWKVVDEDGNVTYTDQAPGNAAPPMKLPELSIIETVSPGSRAQANGRRPVVKEEVTALTAAELRRLYQDFRIARPFEEETFWGTASTVVVTWTSTAPITPDLNVRLFVDGAAQAAPATGGVSLTLDRGEHRVFAELRDASNRRIITTKPVTFFVKQVSVNSNRQRPASSG